ncbi:MAG: DUF1573 domain-containing protein [Chitinophagales bacterium]|jgi:hypothetical protein|nr:DUF1573 domain-containing protein [Chitinophagales bacterium]
MRHFQSLIVLWFCAMLAPIFLSAQPVNPVNDIRPILRKLTPSQKAQVLDYLRQLGADLDREIQQTYEQVNMDKRQKAVLYMNMLLMEGKPLERTTIRINKDTLRFGRIDEGTIVLDSFQITNTGQFPYVISDAKASCDCTVLKYPKYPVMPGETTTIRIEFDSRNKAGEAKPGIILYDNSSPNARNIVYLSGEIVPKVKPRSMSGNN